MRVGGRVDGCRVSGVGADHCVRDAPNVAAALSLELNIDLEKEEVGQEMVDGVVDDAINNERKLDRDFGNALRRHRR